MPSDASVGGARGEDMTQQRRYGAADRERRAVLDQALPALALAPAAWALAARRRAAPGHSSQAPEKLAPATLRLLFRGGQYEEEFHGARNPHFEQKYPGVKLQMESTAGSDHYTKALAAAAGGTSTDLIWSSTGSGGYYSFAVGKDHPLHRRSHRPRQVRPQAVLRDLDQVPAPRRASSSAYPSSVTPRSAWVSRLGTVRPERAGPRSPGAARPPPGRATPAPCAAPPGARSRA